MAQAYLPLVSIRAKLSGGFEPIDNSDLEAVSEALKSGGIEIQVVIIKGDKTGETFTFKVINKPEEGVVSANISNFFDSLRGRGSAKEHICKQLNRYKDSPNSFQTPSSSQTQTSEGLDLDYDPERFPTLQQNRSFDFKDSQAKFLVLTKYNTTIASCSFDQFLETLSLERNQQLLRVFIELTTSTVCCVGDDIQSAMDAHLGLSESEATMMPELPHLSRSTTPYENYEVSPDRVPPNDLESQSYLQTYVELPQQQARSEAEIKEKKVNTTEYSESAYKNFYEKIKAQAFKGSPVHKMTLEQFIEILSEPSNIDLKLRIMNSTKGYSDLAVELEPLLLRTQPETKTEATPESTQIKNPPHDSSASLSESQFEVSHKVQPPLESGINLATADPSIIAFHDSSDQQPDSTYYSTFQDSELGVTHKNRTDSMNFVREKNALARNESPQFEEVSLLPSVRDDRPERGGFIYGRFDIPNFDELSAPQGESETVSTSNALIRNRPSDYDDICIAANNAFSILQNTSTFDDIGRVWPILIDIFQKDTHLRTLFSTVDFIPERIGMLNIKIKHYLNTESVPSFNFDLPPQPKRVEPADAITQRLIWEAKLTPENARKYLTETFITSLQLELEHFVDSDNKEINLLKEIGYSMPELLENISPECFFLTMPISFAQKIYCFHRLLNTSNYQLQRLNARSLGNRKATALANLQKRIVKKEHLFATINCHVLRKKDLIAIENKERTEATIKNILCQTQGHPQGFAPTILNKPQTFGLMSWGDTCYMNASLQILLRTIPPSIVQEMETGLSSKEVEHYNPRKLLKYRFINLAKQVRSIEEKKSAPQILAREQYQLFQACQVACKGKLFPANSTNALSQMRIEDIPQDDTLDFYNGLLRALELEKHPMFAISQVCIEKAEYESQPLIRESGHCDLTELTALTLTPPGYNHQTRTKLHQQNPDLLESAFELSKQERADSLARKAPEWDLGSNKKMSLKTDRSYDLRVNKDEFSSFIITFDGVNNLRLNTGSLMADLARSCFLAAQNSKDGFIKLKFNDSKSGEVVELKFKITSAILHKTSGNSGHFMSVHVKDGNVSVQDDVRDLPFQNWDTEYEHEFGDIEGAFFKKPHKDSYYPRAICLQRVFD
ncbi:hypothetical protein JQC92_12035 [Shewanella sp. 202IG2-18]|uniref:hypothetical protein n=1 Tax=Parashewanella hymeniacidonis TaxID=2807618 RepID=UPI0019610221|nr:hypothetical protein [Parashewanella hymeniacidonis]MBM7072753.1 hypothetical protein [Parashewanella hymeniacidonis]